MDTGICWARGWFARLVMKTKPNATLEQVDEFTWAEAAKVLQLRHYILGVLSAILVAILGGLLSYLPVLRWSVVTLIADIAQWGGSMLGLRADLRWVFIPIVLTFVVSRITWKKSISDLLKLSPMDFINKIPLAAAQEEIAFRDGAETWSKEDKARTCVTNGLLTLSLMIVPLGVAIAVMVLGGFFTSGYVGHIKKTKDSNMALIEVTLVRLVYNCVIVGGGLGVFVVAALITFAKLLY